MSKLQGEKNPRKGNPNWTIGHKKMGGRKKGTQNKSTVYVKDVLEGAAEAIGGLARLIEWIKEAPENEYAFWTSMYMRLLPVHFAGMGKGGAVVLEIKKEDLARQLEERGLPYEIFGTDKPLLELKANARDDPQEESDDRGPRPDQSNGSA